MNSKITVLVVIPVFNRHDDLIKLIDSILTIDNKNVNLHVLIIDDHSEVPVRMAPGWEEKNIQIIRNYTQKGPAYSRNLAVRSTHSDYVWFLDSDAEITNPSVLQNMLTILFSDDRICATGGIMEDIHGKSMILEGRVLVNYLFIYDAFVPEKYASKNVFGISSTNLLIARETFMRVNGFDENLARDEDADLCLTLRKKGYIFYQGRETMVFHRFSDQGRMKAHSNYYESKYRFIKILLKTRLSIMEKHAPSRLFILPVLDFFTSFYLVSRVFQKRFHVKRLRLAGAPMPFSEIFPVMLLVIRNYLQGWRIFFNKKYANQ